MLNCDILIVGCGIVGASAALLLAQQTPLSIIIIDTKSTQDLLRRNLRVSAITQASKNLFVDLKIWQKISTDELSAFESIQVWDERSGTEIDFHGRDLGLNALGYIVQDERILEKLIAEFSNYPQITFIESIELTEIDLQADQALLKEKNNLSFATNLLIAADGAESWVRKKLEIPVKTWSYQQRAIVANVVMEKPHTGFARQCFTRTGPLAFLPLKDPHACSIVWSVESEKSQSLLNMSDEEFKESLRVAFHDKLGAVQTITPRFSFPLQMRNCDKYCRPRLALVGDAAHTVHPMAGQGVNMGLLDIVCLAEQITSALKMQKDYGAEKYLRRFARARKSDNALLIAGVEALHWMYNQDHRLVNTARSFGMQFIHRSLGIKKIIMNYAIGNHS